jgi:alpha-L-fucosidase
MRLHEPAIRGAGASAFTPPPDARYTQAGNRLYLHLFAWPMGHAHLPGLAGRVAYARMLHDHSEVRTVTPEHTELIQHQASGQPEGTLTLLLPIQRPDVAVPVVELILA